MKGATRSVVNFQLPLGTETKNDLPFSLPFIPVGHVTATTDLEVSIVDTEVRMVDLEGRSKRTSISWMN